MLGESYTWSWRLVIFLNKYTSHKEHLDGIGPAEAAVNTVHAILKELVRKAISDTADRLPWLMSIWSAGASRIPFQTPLFTVKSVKPNAPYSTISLPRWVKRR
ncbi:hypothetical protein GIB67_043007 [Kingdonia uniflora]|uniref:Uncharacterized protein n=1 Tax=Kingdonia uniflora TaxID=39325 RepID=A0A7J7NSY9_9MAGN|nr:hypothetical protein GIB67_043007 [Kingdonia uniflora]